MKYFQQKSSVNVPQRFLCLNQKQKKRNSVQSQKMLNNNDEKLPRN